MEADGRILKLRRGCFPGGWGRGSGDCLVGRWCQRKRIGWLTGWRGRPRRLLGEGIRDPVRRFGRPALQLIPAVPLSSEVPGRVA